MAEKQAGLGVPLKPTQPSQKQSVSMKKKDDEKADGSRKKENRKKIAKKS